MDVCPNMPKPPENKLSRSHSQPRTQPLDNGAMCILAPAKLNLNLLVGPVRKDGYHPLDSIVAKVSLYDEIELHPRSDEQLSIKCEGYDCGPDDDNLALLAARKLLACGDGGVDIAVRKTIPPGKGLGGGSSDAAAVLGGLNELRQLGLSKKALAAMGAELGSDVPLFLGPPVLRMTGRGEIIAPADVPGFAAVLILPSFACATAEVYRAFDDSPQEMDEQLADGVISGGASAWSSLLTNQLADAAERVCPELAVMRQRLEAKLQLPLHMSGSGSAMFVLCDDATEAAAIAGQLPADLSAESVIVDSNPW